MNIPAAAAVAAASATRRFLARSGREALRLVREALGDDAVIVTHRITPGGVEIVAVPGEEERAPAALPMPATRLALVAAPAPAPVPSPAPTPSPAPALSPAPARSSAPPVSPVVASRPAASPPAPIAVAPDVSSEAVLQELLSMRGMLEAQLGGRTPVDGPAPDSLHGHLLRLLLGAGFSGRLARAMLAELPSGLAHAQGLAWLKEALAGRLSVVADDDALLDAGGVYALVGPTGVGKTTTTAKLAARCVMRLGADKLALVTTDTFRIGACEQLRIYGRILGVPVHAVKDAGDLRLVLRDLRDKHVVLIDTVGMSQRDRAVAEQIAMLGDAQRPVRRLLVLNATSHGDTLDEVVHAYSGQGLAGCILTKTDEATHHGAVVDTVIRHGLQVHYVSGGQRVPEHLELAQPAQLVDSLFRTRSRTALFVPAEIDVQEQLAPLRNEADVARAQSIAQRLQAQCRQLVRALASDVREVAGHAAALSTAGIGFEQVQALWRELAGAEPADAAAPAALQPGDDCDGHVLATGDGQAMLLLSDRDGRVLGAVAHEGLAGQAFGLPVVLLADAVPGEDPGLPWVARTPGGTRGMLADGRAVKLVALAADLAFSEERAMRWRGQAARQSHAETRVALAAGAAPLRLVVERITDARSGRLLAQRYLLASTALECDATLLLQWRAWRAAAQPCLRQLGTVRRRLAATGFAAASGPAAGRVAQALTTVWRLQRSTAAWAPPTRLLLAQLAGHRARADRGVPAPVLFDGLGRLCVLLEAQAVDAAVLPALAETAECA